MVALADDTALPVTASFVTGPPGQPVNPANLDEPCSDNIKVRDDAALPKVETASNSSTPSNRPFTCSPQDSTPHVGSCAEFGSALHQSETQSPC